MASLRVSPERSSGSAVREYIPWREIVSSPFKVRKEINTYFRLLISGEVFLVDESS